MNKKILSVVLILCVMLAVMPMTAYAADSFVLIATRYKQ